MKILHIHPSMAGGGIEAMICGLVNEMAKVHDVTCAYSWILLLLCFGCFYVA